jgi:hypothetical protein
MNGVYSTIANVLMWGSPLFLVYAGFTAVRKRQNLPSALLILGGALMSFICYTALWFGYPGFIDPANEAALQSRQLLVELRQILLPLGHLLVAVGVLGMVRSNAL